MALTDLACRYTDNECDFIYSSTASGAGRSSFRKVSMGPKRPSEFASRKAKVTKSLIEKRNL